MITKHSLNINFLCIFFMKNQIQVQTEVAEICELDVYHAFRNAQNNAEIYNY